MDIDASTSDPRPAHRGPRPSPTPALPGEVIVVSPRQMRQALFRAGKLGLVAAAVAAHPDEEVRIWWEFATSIEQNHPLVIGMATAVGLDGAATQALFDVAKGL